MMLCKVSAFCFVILSLRKRVTYCEQRIVLRTNESMWPTNSKKKYVSNKPTHDHNFNQVSPKCSNRIWVEWQLSGYKEVTNSSISGTMHAWGKQITTPGFGLALLHSLLYNRANSWWRLTKVCKKKGRTYKRRKSTEQSSAVKWRAEWGSAEQCRKVQSNLGQCGAMCVCTSIASDDDH